MNITIIGSFDFETNDTGGQPVKTRELYYALKNNSAQDSILFVDTYNRKNNTFKVIFTLIKNIRKSDRIIMLPAHNGVKVFSVLIPFFKRRKTRLYYDVIGGWLPELTKANKRLSRRLKKFDGIWVETRNMKNSLEEQGFTNISVVPNFKNITPLRENELVYNTEKPFRFCYFARVAKEKGIEDAVTAIKEINKKYGAGTSELDIYGQINPDYQEGFDSLKKTFDESIKYMGVVKPEKSVETLKDYFALLFPTKFFTEGIPGTIIDAYAAGVPVISSEWQSCHDVVENNKTGIVFEFENYSDFLNIIDEAITNPQSIVQMKADCIKAAEKYQPQHAAEQIFQLMG